MQRIGGAQWCRLQREKVVLGSAVHVACQFDAVVHTLIETPDYYGVLESSRRFSRERSLVQATSDRRDDLGHNEIGHEDVVPPLHDLVELGATGLRKIELQDSTGVAVQGAGQSRAILRASFAEPCPVSARGDRRDPA
jgi:hypothetical protein